MTRRVVILAAAWTVLVVAIILFYPVGALVPRPAGCWTTVGHGAECDAELRALNDRVWWGETVPLLAFIAFGYVAVVLVAIGAKRLRGEH